MQRVILLGIFFVHQIAGLLITQIPTPNIKTGVSLKWDDCSLSIFFVDFQAMFENHSLYRYDFNERKIYSAYIDGESTPIYIFPIEYCKKEPELFAIGLANATKIVRWRKGSTVATVVRTVFNVELHDPNSRLVIGRVDPKGRLYAGTFSYTFCNGQANASFYMYTNQFGLQRIFGNVITTTGIAFNSPAEKLYHLDSCRLQIVEFDEDEKSGNICNGRVVFDFNHDIPNFVPLGLEADSDGMLYVANYTVGSIVKIDPRTSSVIDFIDTGAKALASIAFGGPQHDILFGVAGSSVLNVQTGQIAGSAPANGYLYMIQGLGSKGHSFERLNV